MKEKERKELSMDNLAEVNGGILGGKTVYKITCNNCTEYRGKLSPEPLTACPKCGSTNLTIESNSY